MARPTTPLRHAQPRLRQVVVAAGPPRTSGGRGGGRGSGRGGGRASGGGRGFRSGGSDRLPPQSGSARPPPSPVKVKKAKPPPPPPTSLTAPVQVTVLSTDPPEPAPSPLWATFCGTVEGGWSGVASAVNPLTGEAEALLPPGPGGVPPAALHLASYTVEQRVVADDDAGGGGGGDGGGGPTPPPPDRLDRRTVRGRTLDALAPAADAGEWVAADALGSREPGLIIFDGGSYSRGPLSLLGEGGEATGGSSGYGGGGETVRAELERLVAMAGAGEGEGGDGDVARASAALEDDDDDDDDRPASSPDAGWDDSPPTVSVLEACVAWGGEARVRVALTLGVGLDPATGELDVTPLRLLAVREAWQCLSDADVASCAAAFGGDGRPPPSAAAAAGGVHAFAGEWKAFDVCGHALAPATAAAADAVGGPATASAAHAVYSTACSRQVWGVGGGPGDGGGAYILPGSGTTAPPPARANSSGGGGGGGGLPPSTPAPGPALVELVMLPPVSRGPAGDAAEGMAPADDDDDPSTPPPGRGLLISVSWCPRDGTVVGVQREYDAGGALVEARCRSAVRVDAAGGAM